MRYFKDSNNDLHAIENEATIARLPADCVEIDKIEAEAIMADNQEGSQVPESVSRFQALAALHNADLLDSVKTLMADPATDPIAVLAWENGQTFARTSPTIATMGAALGLSDADLDSLFIAAAQITA